MKKKLLLAVLILTTSGDSFSQSCIKPVAATEQAYIKQINLDSISKNDLLNEQTIHLKNDEYKILRADAYFYEGAFFPNLIKETIPSNNLKWLFRDRIMEAKTPFKLTLAGIWFRNKHGKEELAKDITLVVY